MKLLTKKNAMINSIGIYLNMEKTADSQVVAQLIKSSKYHQHVTLSLPEMDDDQKPGCIAGMLNTIMDGCNATVRADWDNLSEHLSISQMQIIDHLISPASLYIYGVPESLVLDIARDQWAEDGGKRYSVRSAASVCF